MFRLSKITDYGIVILAHLAQNAAQNAAQDAAQAGHDGRRDAVAPASQTAREVAAAVELPQPVVGKILKSLARHGVLESHRGAKGGYSLVRRPEELTVADMISALDGPLALTQCAAGPEVCELEHHCAIRNPWQVINQVVVNALSTVTLADLTNPAFTRQHTPLSLLATSPAGSDALPTSPE
jgi:FeS assembly SUF system regulator